MKLSTENLFRLLQCVFFTVLLLLSGCSFISDNFTSESDQAVVDEDASAQPHTMPGSEAEKVLAIGPNPHLNSDLEIDEEARGLFSRAIEAVKEDKQVLAKQLFSQLVEKYPELSGPYVNLGIIYEHEGDDQRAEKFYRQALAINHNNLDAYNHLGLLYRHRGQFDQAESFYLQAVLVWPGYAEGYYNLGILYELYMGRLSDALEQFQKYQQLQEKPDRKVEGWIKDLQRRIQQGETDQ